MEQIPTWVGVIATLFVIVATLAGAVAIALSKANTTRQGLLEANNKTLTERVALLEEDLSREREKYKTDLEKKELAHVAEVKEYKAQTEGLQEKVAVLEKVVTGREQLEHILELLIAHDQRVDTFYLQQEQHSGDAIERFRTLNERLSANHDLLTSIAQEVIPHDEH